MEPDLTDEEFFRLARTSASPIKILIYEDPVDLQPIDKALWEKGLTKYWEKDPQDPMVVSQCLMVTDLGYWVLRQNRLKLVLCLLDLKFYTEAFRHMKSLTQEELPTLLTHDHIVVRAEATNRMHHCLARGGSNEEKHTGEIYS